MLDIPFVSPCLPPPSDVGEVGSLCVVIAWASKHAVSELPSCPVTRSHRCTRLIAPPLPPQAEPAEAHGFQYEVLLDSRGLGQPKEPASVPQVRRGILCVWYLDLGTLCDELRIEEWELHRLIHKITRRQEVRQADRGSGLHLTWNRAVCEKR